MTWQAIPLGQPCDGLGQCGLGVVECGKGFKPTCSTNFDGTAWAGTPELCNGLDDDCDGFFDDELFWQGIPVGGPCDGTGACGPGTVVCSPVDGKPTCSTNPNGGAPESKSESCNGLDDDCDGKTDETFPESGAPCDGPDADFCKTGVYQCLATGLTCVDDIACAAGSQCLDPGEPEPQFCACQGQPCSVLDGDACAGTGCRCAGGPACTGDKLCEPSVGCL